MIRCRCDSVPEFHLISLSIQIYDTEVSNCILKNSFSYRIIECGFTFSAIIVSFAFYLL